MLQKNILWKNLMEKIKEVYIQILENNKTHFKIWFFNIFANNLVKRYTKHITI